LVIVALDEARVLLVRVDMVAKGEYKFDEFKILLARVDIVASGA
jgi:hypothetical protein